MFPSSSSEAGSHEYRTAKSTPDNNSPRSSNPRSRSSSPLPKPPIPVFNRPHSLRRSVDGRPKAEDPPTTTLSVAEHAELVKKTRKLTQVFGQTPRPDLASLSPPTVSRTPIVTTWALSTVRTFVVSRAWDWRTPFRMSRRSSRGAHPNSSEQRSCLMMKGAGSR